MKNVERLCELKLPQGQYHYLASPYSLYPDGLEAAYHVVREISIELVLVGIPHYVPILHTHEAAQHAGIDPLDQKFFAAADMPWMEEAHDIVIVLMRGWDCSVGIRREMEWFEERDRPVWSLDPALLLPEECVA